MARIAVIDIGTVTARVCIADKELFQPLQQVQKLSTICNLGEGVAESGRLCASAIQRVLCCVEEYVALARSSGAQAIACTLTSAARDAANASELLGPLSALGLCPEVIPGRTEGELSLLGVAQDFPEQELLVVDSGGGSTEFAKGGLFEGQLRADVVRSIDVGCRRITERFLAAYSPPTAAELEQARLFCDAAFEATVSELAVTGPLASQLVLVGGTATSLVAMVAALEPYDPDFVHLHKLSHREIEKQIARLAEMTEDERAHVKGLQPKRASVILGGCVAVSQAMRGVGFSVGCVSEHDLLTGLSIAAASAWLEETNPLSWKPQLKAL